MKVTLDLDRLLDEGHITEEERARLQGLASQETSSLALNVLIAFGGIAVAGGALALIASPIALVPLGIALAATGVYLEQVHAERSRPLGTILLLVGSLAAGAGVIVLTDGTALGFAVVAGSFGGAALFAWSGLLAGLSALALLSASGGLMGYTHATYWLGIEHPGLTVVLFGVLSYAAYRLSLLLSGDSAAIVIIFSRTCLFIVNLGMWIGSLWGDHWRGAAAVPGVVSAIPAWVFVVAWARGLLAVGAWAARSDRR